MKATLSSKGQLALPKPARDALGSRTGSVLKVEVTSGGGIAPTPLLTLQQR